ncbi:Quinone oxidoreductase 2 [Apilactobacillus kunkeei]|nr:Quinone oxidoreductase 2 [Apilactobacillus kunkeei]
MKYAISAVTGNFGKEAIKVLMKNVHRTDIVALARNVEKAEKQLPAGLDVRPFDYGNPDQMAESLQGIDKLLFVSSQPNPVLPRMTQHQNVIDAAKKAGVEFIVYTSFPHAETADNFLSHDHTQTEAAIKESGIAHAFVRNNWYLENEATVLKPASEGQPFVYGAGDGHVGWALESEYAEGAVRVLLSKSPKEVYEFAGQRRTYADLAEALKKATGKDFPVISASAEDYKKGLKEAGLDDATVEIVSDIQALIADGQLDEETNDLTAVISHSLTPIEDAIKKVIK